MTTPPTSTAVVVGAGIIGCSIALELSRRGWARHRRRQGLDPRVRFHQRLFGHGAVQLRQPAGGGARLGVARALERLGQASRGRRPGGDGDVRQDRAAGAGRRAAGPPARARPHGDPRHPLRDRRPPSRSGGGTPRSTRRGSGPACRVEDEHFWDDPTGEIGGFVQHDSGFVNDATLAAHNLAHAAEQFGATFRWRSTVVDVVRDETRVGGVRLADGTELRASVGRERRRSVVGGAQHDGRRARRLQHLDPRHRAGGHLGPGTCRVRPRRRRHRRPRPRLRHVLPTAPRGNDHRRQLRGRRATR